MKIDTQAQKTDYQAPLPSGGVGGGLLGGGCQGWAWVWEVWEVWVLFAFPHYIYTPRVGDTDTDAGE